MAPSPKAHIVSPCTPKFRVVMLQQEFKLEFLISLMVRMVQQQRLLHQMVLHYLNLSFMLAQLNTQRKLVLILFHLDSLLQNMHDSWLTLVKTHSTSHTSPRTAMVKFISLRELWCLVRIQSKSWIEMDASVFAPRLLLPPPVPHHSQLKPPQHSPLKYQALHPLHTLLLTQKYLQRASQRLPRLRFQNPFLFVWDMWLLGRETHT